MHNRYDTGKIVDLTAEVASLKSENAELVKALNEWKELAQNKGKEVIRLKGMCESLRTTENNDLTHNLDLYKEIDTLKDKLSRRNAQIKDLRAKLQDEKQKFEDFIDAHDLQGYITN